MLGDHLAHAALMQEELNRLQITMPGRYRELTGVIAPLVTTHTLETAKKLANVRIEMHQLRRAIA